MKHAGIRPGLLLIFCLAASTVLCRPAFVQDRQNHSLPASRSLFAPVLSYPKPFEADKNRRDAGPDYWYEHTDHGSSPFGGQPGYEVFRNVRDYGAVGDGITDDTAAINAAIEAGGRCGLNCGSSTVHPAVVYFNPGTYLVSRPIVQYYNTILLGNPNSRPTIKATSKFEGIAMIDSNVYIDGGWGAQWYITQSNFYRQVRNFVLDMRDMRKTSDYEPTGIHWQVAQATSLQNVEFIMSRDPLTTQRGIYMENGSGGFIGDLHFIGGRIGMYCGSQQFTVRNIHFEHCREAIRMIWTWGWTWHGLNIFNCDIGINAAQPAPGKPDIETGSITILDSVMTNVHIGMLASKRTQIVVENVRLENTQSAIKYGRDGEVAFDGGDIFVDQYVVGTVYDQHEDRLELSGSEGRVTSEKDARERAPLLDEAYCYFARSKPQYEEAGLNRFVNIKSKGAAGNGVVDDTLAINNALRFAAERDLILYFPHGAYLVTDTITFPPGTKVVGEAWAQIMGTGQKFNNIMQPHVMIRVGNQGDVGTMEISEMLFTTKGPTAGAVLMEWNIRGSHQGAAAMWDSHFRVGGAKGTDLQVADCPKHSGSINPNCIGGALLLHLTESSSAYLENVWPWVADHDLDILDQTQIDIYVARGMKIDSKIATWLWAVAPEHCVMYQYLFSGAEFVFASTMQTETPYFQTSPPAPEPFGLGKAASYLNDPMFSQCTGKEENCAMAWALMIIGSSKIVAYGAGFYVWFQKYEKDACISQSNCQRTLALVENSSDVWIFNLYTKGAENMVEARGNSVSAYANTELMFCAHIAAYHVRMDIYLEPVPSTAAVQAEPTSISPLGIHESPETHESPAIHEQPATHEPSAVADTITTILPSAPSTRLSSINPILSLAEDVLPQTGLVATSTLHEHPSETSKASSSQGRQQPEVSNQALSPVDTVLDIAAEFRDSEIDELNSMDNESHSAAEAKGQLTVDEALNRADHAHARPLVDADDIHVPPAQPTVSPTPNISRPGLRPVRDEDTGVCGYTFGRRYYPQPSDTYLKINMYHLMSVTDNPGWTAGHFVHLYATGVDEWVMFRNRVTRGGHVKFQIPSPAPENLVGIAVLRKSWPPAAPIKIAGVINETPDPRPASRILFDVLVT